VFLYSNQNSGSSVLAAYSAQLGHLVRQRHAETALRDTQHRAEALATSLRRVLEQTRAESDYLVNMSHELRTLLNAIIGFSSLMREESSGPLPESYRDHANDIYESGQDLMSLIETFSEENAMLLPPARGLHETSVDVGAIIRTAYQSLREFAQNRAIKVQARLARALPPLYSDEECLQQMLIDLIGEAIRLAPEATVIELIARCADDGKMIFQFVSAVAAPNAQPEAGGAQRTDFDEMRANFLASIHDATLGFETAEDGRRVATLAFPATRVITGSAGQDMTTAAGAA
jgi:two-component system cell cycle sensor histidine kinase PleC